MQQGNSRIYILCISLIGVVLLIILAGFAYWIYSESKAKYKTLSFNIESSTYHQDKNNKQALIDLEHRHKFDIDSKNLQESNEVFENPKQNKTTINTKSIVKFKVDDRPNNEEASTDDLDSNKLYNLDFKEDLKEDLEEFNWNLNVDLNPDSKHKKTKDNITNKHLNKNTSEKPKLAIIIDDLAMPKDIEAFKALDLKLNLSLFPKHAFSRHNPKMAKKLEFYMIHLPLEANEFKQKGVRAINTGDSIEVIESYIKEIKQDFPNLRYINNHTGSRYTSSKQDMEKLLNVLDKHGIIFVDSKTSSSDVIKNLYQMRNQVYIQRDIFLDNQSNSESILEQLEKALNLANKRGFAIVIGHPKKNTLNVLKQYSNKLRSEYELVYINEIEEFLQKQTQKTSIQEK